MSDEELIERIRQGDRNAADELIRRYNPLIFRYCLYRCGNKETAEDLTQETFLRLIKYLPKYENYITSQSRRTYTDERGVQSTFIDEDIKSRIRLKLMIAIMRDFDVDSPPPGETIED